MKKCLPSVVLTCILSLSLIFFQSPNARPLDAIAAVVNQDIITKNELESRLIEVTQRLRAQNVEPPAPEALRKQVLEHMIVELAELQAAKDQGFVVDNRTLDATIARIAQENQLSLPEFFVQLERDHVALPAFRDKLRKEILLRRIRDQKLEEKIRISESDIDNYLASLAGQTAAEQEVNLSQIWISIPENPTANQITQSQQRAEQAMGQLRQGRNFANVAATYSDAQDALRGGDIGWRPMNSLPQLFVDALRTTTPEEVTSILRSPSGFHILKLNARRTPSTADDALPIVEQTHARHILIKVTPTMSATEAQRRLRDFKTRLDHGTATFEQLANNYSNDASASNGGDLGWIYPGDTVPEFERAMDALAIGEVSAPIESPFGLHLIQVLERRQDNISADRRRMAARTAIRARRTDEALNEWLRSLRDSTYVEYREEG